MRKIEVKDKKLVEILSARAEIFKKVGEINEELSRLDKERTKEGYKMNRLKEKTEPIIEKYKNSFDLQEFEIISRVYLENNVAYVDIVDLIEEYKTQLKEKNNENSGNNSNKQ